MTKINEEPPAPAWPYGLDWAARYGGEFPPDEATDDEPSDEQPTDGEGFDVEHHIGLAQYWSWNVPPGYATAFAFAAQFAPSLIEGHRGDALAAISADCRDYLDKLSDALGYEVKQVSAPVAMHGRGVDTVPAYHAMVFLALMNDLSPRRAVK